MTIRGIDYEGFVQLEEITIHLAPHHLHVLDQLALRSGETRSVVIADLLEHSLVMYQPTP